MNHENLEPGNEKFSNNPEENLDMENQFLKLKLMAETGAKFFEGESEVPPEIMNEWLKNVAKFEEQYANSEQKPLKEIMGSPIFRPSADLNDDEFNKEYEKLQALLNEHHIDVSFIREREDRFKYDFITSELLDHETTLFPGMMTNFIYEEFHPDHELEIRNRTNEFFDAFFERRLGDLDNPFFEGEFVFPDGRLVPAEDMTKRFQAMYEAVPGFEDCSYQIDKIDFELKITSADGEEEESGMGYSEGTVRYDVIFQNGERKTVEGPFKIYFSMRWDWWSLFFFYLSGFNIHRRKENPEE